MSRWSAPGVYFSAFLSRFPGDRVPIFRRLWRLFFGIVGECFRRTWCPIGQSALQDRPALTPAAACPALSQNPPCPAPSQNLPAQPVPSTCPAILHLPLCPFLFLPIYAFVVPFLSNPCPITTEHLLLSLSKSSPYEPTPPAGDHLLPRPPTFSPKKVVVRISITFSTLARP